MAKALAEKLGNAIVAPILAYSTNNSSPDLRARSASPARRSCHHRESRGSSVQQGFKKCHADG